MTTTYKVLQGADSFTTVEATDFGITEGTLYLYDDNRKDSDQTVGVFPEGAWYGIRVTNE